jgi:hypothetical protein
LDAHGNLVSIQRRPRGIDVRLPASLEGDSTQLRVAGVYFTPWYRRRAVSPPALRLSIGDRTMKVGHGLSEEELRRIADELRPFVGVVQLG